MKEVSESLEYSDSSFSVAEKIKELGNSLFDDGKFLEAIETYTEAIAIHPRYAAAYYNRAQCKAHLKRDIEAISDFSEAIRLSPNDADYYGARGASKNELYLYPQAILDFTEAIRIAPNNAMAYENCGIVKCNQRLFSEAIENFTEAIRINSKRPISFSLRGYSYLQLAKYAEAIDDCSQAIFLDIQYWNPYITRAKAYLKLGKNDNALADYCSAIPFSMGLLPTKQNYSRIDEVLKFRAVNGNLLSSLKNREIWFAHSRTFNDADDGEYLRKLFPENQSISDLLGKILMFSCFGNSSNSQNTQFQENEKQQMWAHYGAESAGICLHFKYSPESAQKGNLFMLDSVKYSDDIKFDENQSQYDVIRHGFFTKSTAWKSENEYRFITMASDKTVRSEDGRCIGQLVNEFDLGLTLSAVEFGARCRADDVLKVKEALMQRKDSANIKLYQVKLGTAADPFRWSKEQII
jgi:tetratricopeptide (TPR) repeat protein